MWILPHTVPQKDMLYSVPLAQGVLGAVLEVKTSPVQPRFRTKITWDIQLRLLRLVEPKPLDLSLAPCPYP